MKDDRRVKTVTIKQVQEEFSKRNVTIGVCDDEGDGEGGAAKVSPTKRKHDGSQTWVTKIMAIYTRLDEVDGLVALLRKN